MTLHNDDSPDVAALGFGFGHRGSYWQLHDADWLHQAHVEQGWGSKRIAREIGCCPKAVRVALTRNSIERPLTADAVVDPRLMDAAWVRERYIGDRLSTLEIAALCGCDRSTAARWVRVHGIERRSNAGARGVG
jgi:hypothetical protein